MNREKNKSLKEQTVGERKERHGKGKGNRNLVPNNFDWRGRGWGQGVGTHNLL